MARIVAEPPRYKVRSRICSIYSGSGFRKRMDDGDLLVLLRACMISPYTQGPSTKLSPRLIFGTHRACTTREYSDRSIRVPPFSRRKRDGTGRWKKNWQLSGVYRGLQVPLNGRACDGKTREVALAFPAKMLPAR